MIVIILHGDNNAPRTMVQGARCSTLQASGLAHSEMVLVKVGHALAQHLHRLELLEHDRLAALSANAAGHEVRIVALRQRGARRLGKLALLRHLVSLPLIGASMSATEVYISRIAHSIPHACGQVAWHTPPDTRTIVTPVAGQGGRAARRS